MYALLILCPSITYINIKTGCLLNPATFFPCWVDCFYKHLRTISYHETDCRHNSQSIWHFFSRHSEDDHYTIAHPCILGGAGRISMLDEYPMRGEFGDAFTLPGWEELSNDEKTVLCHDDYNAVKGRKPFMIKPESDDPALNGVFSKIHGVWLSNKENRYGKAAVSVLRKLFTPEYVRLMSRYPQYECVANVIEEAEI